MLEKEIWRVIPLASKYLISSLGRIYNSETQFLVKPYFHKSRASGFYLRVNLGKKKHMVHLLVAETYPDLVPKPNLDCTQIDHNDGNKLNPAAYNIRWVTPGFNARAFHASRWIKFNNQTYRIKLR